MNTLRNRALRVAASSLLFVVLGVGAHAFVQPAYGCGNTYGSGCIASTTSESESDWLSEIAFFVGVAELVLP
jgi:hypothetical protein